jgi:Ca2+-binding RTX toxin-like protein
MRCPTLVALLFWIALAAPASAAVVTAGPRVDSGNGKGPDLTQGTALAVVAGAGERNVIDVSADSAGFLVTDTATAPAPGVGCVAVSPVSVRCARQGRRGAPDAIDVAVGDLGDMVTSAVAATIDLGSGDDRATVRVGGTVNGGDGADVLIGSDGADTLDGGPGTDELRAGAGDDDLQGGDTTAVDLVDGGPGIDTVLASDTRQAVRADLQAAGFAGDMVVNVENAHGAFDDDVLLGSAGPNVLVGEGSRHGDRLDGRDGDDVLDDHEPGPPSARLRHDVMIGGTGDDQISATRGARIDAGPGDDLIEGDRDFFDPDQPDGTRDVHLTCGGGTDTVDNIDLTMPGDCELARIAHVASIARPTISNTTLRVALRPAGRTCQLALRTLIDGHPWSRWTPTLRLRPSATTTRTVRLTRRTPKKSILELQLRTRRCVSDADHPGYHDGRRSVRFADILPTRPRG